MIELNDIFSQAKAALDDGMPDRALRILDTLSVGNTGEVLFLKGEIYFKLQKWGEALNHFSAYQEQFPDEKQAESYILMIQNILGFYHRDLYNP